MTLPGKKTEGKIRDEHFPVVVYVVFLLITVLIFCFCVGVGSVRVPLTQTIRIIVNALRGVEQLAEDRMYTSILLSVRLPRVLCVALSGAALSLSGAAMQGLLKNPLADGSTLGVSTGASLGAVLAIAFDLTVPFLSFAGPMPMAMLTSFLSMIFILALAFRIDHSLSTNTIILMGIIFSMFIHSLISLIMTLAPDRTKHYTFWTMGSLAGTVYRDALLLTVALLVCGGLILFHATELNAFAIGEENARNIGINVRRVRLTILVAVSAMIGVCVSVGGTIGFAGLVTPHMVRFFTGSNHRRLLPATLFGGASFLMMTDLVARVILSPLELPIGVVTSFIGAPLFVYIFYRRRGSA